MTGSLERRMAASRARRRRDLEADRRRRLEQEATLLLAGDPAARARDLPRQGSATDRALLEQILTERRAATPDSQTKKGTQPMSADQRDPQEIARLQKAATARRKERADEAAKAVERQTVDPRFVGVSKIGSPLADAADPAP